jgi:hypothetical protein
VAGLPLWAAFPRGFSGRPRLRGWSGQVVVGGPCAAVKRRCQPGCHGQLAGRCRVRRRAERAIRAGRLISWARIVAVLARAWKVEASGRDESRRGGPESRSIS